MIKSEYIRNLNRNYERVLLKPGVNNKRYQYQIVARGGIRHLLPCGFVYIDGAEYLDFDISSRQNIRQVFADRSISREWMKAFLGEMQCVRQELNRFLLDEKNILWTPEHIYQDLEKYELRYMYLPYYGQEGESEEGFDRLLDFWVERVDYDDDGLVEFVYHAYDQYMKSGLSYLEKQIFMDYSSFEKKEDTEAAVRKTEIKEEKMAAGTVDLREKMYSEEHRNLVNEEAPERKSLFSFFDGKRRKPDLKLSYREELRQRVNGYAVCEETIYNSETESRMVPEEYGRTIYIEEKEKKGYALYTEDGVKAMQLEKFPFVVGKRKEDVDYVLTDYSASRLHARFLREEDDVYIEDLNSTNGTFKNGLRLLPYEKKKLEPDDSLRFGKSTFIYKYV